MVHPSHGHYQDTLSNRLHGYFQKKGEQVTIRSIGRLDRDTSGILAFAKNQVAAARLWKQKEEGIFWKEYLAVCERRADSPLFQTIRILNSRKAEFPEKQSEHWQTIDAPIGKMDGSLMKMCVREDGLRAVTHYQVIRQNEKYVWLRVRIDTGRTHQIRVHMAWSGHPLAGDVLYNSRERSSEPQDLPLQLCAWKAELQQPFTQEVIKLTAPYWAEDMLPNWILTEGNESSNMAK